MLILAHAGHPPEPHDLWTAWNLDPLLLLGLMASWVVYQRGVAAFSEPERTRRTRWFVGGLAGLVLALVSPIDAVGEALASVHMLQHLILVLVAAPMLALGRPAETLLLGMPLGVRKTVGRLRRHTGLGPARVQQLAHPMAIWLVYASVLWLWHLPGPYQLALGSEPVHSLEHISFLGVAVVLWHLVLIRLRRLRGLAVLVVFVAGLQGTILAALLTFSGSPWYPAYATTTAAWGLSPLDDQQLAGVLMWVPGGMVHLGIGLSLFARWVKETERQAQLFG